jgi:protein-tyrosine phosphatase
MVDIHCHLLPGIDDGPSSWEATLKMCEIAAEDGISAIVATPHCNHRYPYDRQASQAKLDELRSRIPGFGLVLGCEVTLTENNLENVRRHPAGYTIGATNYMLVELGPSSLPQQIDNALSELLSLGLVPIIVHPERVPLIQRQVELLEEWVSYGCMSALTGNALTGFWGSTCKKMAETILKKDLTHVITSDAHDPAKRPPVLAKASKAAARIVGEQRAEELVTGNPEAIVRGEAI